MRSISAVRVWGIVSLFVTCLLASPAVLGKPPPGQKTGKKSSASAKQIKRLSKTLTTNLVVEKRFKAALKLAKL